MTFSLVTINTWKAEGDYAKRLPVLASGFLKQKPNLIASQEVFHAANGFISTKSYLETQLKMKAYFFPSRKKLRKLADKNVNSYSGLCLFTNLEVLKYTELVLPTNPMDGDRTAQFIIVQHQKKIIGLVNTHLTHLKNQSELRKEQIAYILNHIHMQDLDLFIICGDFNDIHHSTTIDYLMHEPQAFKNVFDFNTATHISGKKLDYVLYNSNLEIKVTDCKLILNQLENHILPSDHFGLYASFHIKSL